jgi:CRISPR type III-B/RAMP module RAMP protein Cmr1
MPLPPWHDLKLKLVTTAFLGRFPDGQTTGEIPFPIPSLRGVLAYWLRALAGPYVGDDIAGLRQVETELFGTAAGEGPARPSRILLRSRQRIAVSEPPTEEEVTTGYAGLAYLMNQGLTNDKNQKGGDGGKARRVRPREFTVSVRNLGDPLHADLFNCALWALRAFGGIGARSRRGFGTLAVTAPMRHLPVKRFDLDWLHRDNIEDFSHVRECVHAALADLDVPHGSFVSTPSYPCFLDGLFYVEEHVIKNVSDDLSCLALVGKLFRDFRRPRKNSKGRPTITRGYDDVVRPFIAHKRPTKPFLDGAFGLPVSYTLNSGNGTATIEPVASDEILRRASPLWLRVTNIRGEWRLRSLAFYTDWLPDSVTLRLKSDGRKPEIIVKPSPREVGETIESWFAHLKKPNLGEPLRVLGSRSA